MARPRKTFTVDEKELIHTPKNDFQRFWMHLQENPLLYLGAAAFIALCVVAGILVRVSGKAAERDTMSRYAQAMLEQEPAARLARLEELAPDAGKWTAEVVYVMGESAIEANDLEKARQAFDRVGREFAKSPYAARALDGIAFIEESAGNYQAALDTYQRVMNEFPGDFVARRKPFDIGRMQEKLGLLAEAATSYESQQERFPDSIIAGKAEQALEKLKAANPELFPEPVALDSAPETAADTAPATDEAPVADEAPEQ